MFKKPVFTLIAICLVFGGAYIYLAKPLPFEGEVSHRFDWPDETANYFWSSYYSETGDLIYPESLSQVAQNQIHPRSFNVRSDGSLVPGSFLGLILLYGSLAKIFSSSLLIYFTPIFAIVGVLAFYGIIRRIFDDKTAFVSAILLLMHPAWWYYSVTSMLPNVTFISLFLLGIYVLIKNKQAYFLDILIAGFLIGLSVSIRPSEVIWMLIVMLGILILRGSRIKFSQVIILMAVSAFAIAPSLIHQQALYGDYLASGYSQLQSETFGTCQSCEVVKSIILPFGFHPTLIASNIWVHYLSRMWWISLITLLGLIAFLVQTKKQKEEIFGYVIMSMFVFGWLGIYYGSWEFTDKLTVHLNTLGISYVRYFLPLFILAVPFTARGLIWVSNIFRPRWRNFGLAILLLGMLYPAANLVLAEKPDSILPVKQRILSYKQNAAAVMKETEANSVIVTVRKDKVFFPERKVIHTFEALSLNDDLREILLDLVKVAPVYYYALGPEPELEFANGLRLEYMRNIGQEILYKVYVE